MKVRSPYVGAVLDELRVLAVAGITTGLVVAGAGSRLAMLVLRVTSPDNVRGVTSDDGFSIGRFTLGGTYGLFVLGGFVGVIGAAAYQWVRPWLLGRQWFRLLTLALGSGAVVGSMLVHADGVDFTLLKPTWLAVALFVALPAVFAVVIGLAVDRVERTTSWTRRRPFVWLLPIILVAATPPTLVALGVAAPILAVWVAIRDEESLRAMRATHTASFVIRGAWLAAALLGLLALLGDIAKLCRVV